MGDLSLTALAFGLLASAGTVAVVLLATFAVGVARDRHSVIDTVWGLGFTAIAGTSLVVSAGHGDAARRYLVAGLTALWGVRLAVHIGRRARGRGEDRRYVAMLAKAPGSRHLYAVKVVYLPQAVAMWWVSLPLQVAMEERRPLGALGYLGAAVTLVGIGFEAIGDHQLSRFLADPVNAGRVMDQGLWRYTRHPNYFGDACVWWGLYLVAAQQLPGALTVLSPIAMTVLLTRGTGKALLERTLGERRPGYDDYVRRTSGFIPRRPAR